MRRSDVASLAHNQRVAAFAFLALCSAACSGAESPPRKSPANQESLAVRDSTGIGSGVEGADDRRPIILMVTRVDEVANEEGGVVFRGVDSPSPPGPHLHDTVLYADVRALANTLSPDAQLGVDGTVVLINDRPLSVPAHRHGPALYGAVKPFAREFGAYVQRMDARGSTTIWPQDVLQYLVKERDPDPPVVQEARAEGLVLPP